MINQNFIKVVSAGSAVGLLTGRRTLQGYSFSKQVCAKYNQRCSGVAIGAKPPPGLVKAMDFMGFQDPTGAEPPTLIFS